MRYKGALLTLCLIACMGSLSCLPPGGGDPESYIYRQRMRSFVQSISAYARTVDPGFLVIPQNGTELVAADPEESVGEKALLPAVDYLEAISGVGREDLFYGYDADNRPTPADVREEWIAYLDLAEANGVQALITDYCWTPSKMDLSYQNNAALGYIAFAADHRELDDIPGYPTVPYGDNADDITSLADAHNFLYVLNPGAFASRAAYLEALAAARHDAIIMDLFFDGNNALTPAEVASLKVKPQGGSRLVIAYMSIGEAEDYRFYWQSSWRPGSPAWIVEENPNWDGNYVVEYWQPAWQAVIFGSENAFLDRILAAGFDGVYLDIIDAFEYFE